MKLSTPLYCLALLAAPALAQDAESVKFEAQTGPVTVVSQQGPLPNADEYQVKVADLDANGDGRIGKSEVPRDHALYFEWHLVDTNRDGAVTEAELAAWK